MPKLSLRTLNVSAAHHICVSRCSHVGYKLPMMTSSERTYPASETFSSNFGRRFKIDMLAKNLHRISIGVAPWSSYTPAAPEELWKQACCGATSYLDLLLRITHNNAFR